MTIPQLENGYTRIANEIMDALIAYRIPGEQMQCALLVLRKTYGYGKKSDMIANSQFCEATGLKKPNVCRAINGLVDKNIVIKKDNTRVPTYQFNKNFKTWKRLSKKITVIKKDNQLLSKKIPTKETLTKEIPPLNPPKGKADEKFYPLKAKPDFIKETDWKDIVDHRKKMRSANTERAYRSLIKELRLAVDEGYSVESCVDKMTNRSWKGFEAKWMSREKNGKNRKGGNQTGFTDAGKPGRTNWSEGL